MGAHTERFGEDVIVDSDTERFGEDVIVGADTLRGLERM